MAQAAAQDEIDTLTADVNLADEQASENAAFIATGQTGKQRCQANKGANKGQTKGKQSTVMGEFAFLTMRAR